MSDYKPALLAYLIPNKQTLSGNTNPFHHSIIRSIEMIFTIRLLAFSISSSLFDDDKRVNIRERKTVQDWSNQIGRLIYDRYLYDRQFNKPLKMQVKL